MRALKTISIFFLLTLCACNSDHYISLRGYAQGGEYSVTINLKGVHTPPKVISQTIDSLFSAIDFSISGYNHNSLLSRHNAGEEIVADQYFSELLSLSEQYSALSGGAFDIYAAPLFEIWGFGFSSGSLPSDELVKQTLEQCQLKKTLNFNAIAQGYSCDIIAGYLHSIGVEDMLVNVGEIYCEGLNPNGEGWTIGVDNPIDGNNIPGAQLKGIWQGDGSGKGVVTSGNYRKFYIRDGKKYAHTIDPRSGYPVEHNMLSATITAPCAAQADALATACMVLGPEEAKSLINSLDGVEGYFIFSDGVWTSEGMNIF